MSSSTPIPNGFTAVQMAGVNAQDPIVQDNRASATASAAEPAIRKSNESINLSLDQERVSHLYNSSSDDDSPSSSRNSLDFASESAYQEPNDLNETLEQLRGGTLIENSHAEANSASAITSTTADHQILILTTLQGLSKAVTDLGNSNIRLEIKIDKQNKTIASLEKRINVQAMEIMKLHNENGDIKVVNSKLIKENSITRAENSRLNTENNITKENNRKLNTEINNVKTENSEIRNRNRNIMGRQLKTMEHLQNALESLKIQEKKETIQDLRLNQQLQNFESASLGDRINMVFNPSLVYTMAQRNPEMIKKAENELDKLIELQNARIIAGKFKSEYFAKTLIGLKINQLISRLELNENVNLPDELEDPDISTQIAYNLWENNPSLRNGSQDNDWGTRAFNGLYTNVTPDLKIKAVLQFAYNRPNDFEKFAQSDE